MRNMLIIAFAAFVLSACTGALSQEQLVGKWNYVEVGVPNSSPPDTVTRAELEENKPYILFKQDNTFSITWGGKMLSHGTYQLSGKNINVKEVLPDGKTRDFPFYVSEISGKKITFETTGADGSRVTAVKE